MPQLFKQFITFAAVGALCTAIQYVLIAVGVYWWGDHTAVTLSAVGYALGTIVSYLLNYSFTFKSQHGQKSHRDAMSKFYTIAGIGWLLNTGLMALLVGQWHIGHWPAQLFTTAVGLIWNFAGSRWWAFRHPASLSSEIK